MNSIILQFLFGAACIGTGFFAGLSLSWREYRFGEKRFAAPTLPHTEGQQAYLLVVVALLAVASTVYGARQAAVQADCNREFRESLVARSSISAENQRHIDDVFNAFADAVAKPTPDSREHIQKVILEYREWSVTAERQRAENPIRDPKCGGS